jgi:murein DD-endopeptidase MepM/ murein hydrolase activator NlpD
MLFRKNTIPSNKAIPKTISTIVLSIVLLFFFVAETQAQSISELQQKITNHNSTIKELEKEIATYQAQAIKIGKEADTLSNAIQSLDISKKKLETDISLTQAKIDKTSLEIKQLGNEIGNKVVNISDNKSIIANSLRKINQTDNIGTTDVILSNKSFSELWQDIENIEKLHTGVKNKISELESIKDNLEYDKSITEKKKAELVSLKQQLDDQKQAIISATKEKQNLLKETKNTEANYRALIGQKAAQKEAFEKELFAFESALKIAIDPNSLPRTGSGVLKWPVANPFITQYFGNTEFATANAQIYNGSGHTGIDLRASIGTPIYAASSGIVSGAGNTDAYSGCWSYGKWIFLKHNNGLSTLYAHLSVISVNQGQTVNAGQIIGYSGNTGYSTGPHLHFGVYATQGVRIQKFDTSIRCKEATIPLADPKAYLNPLSYL